MARYSQLEPALLIPTTWIRTGGKITKYWELNFQFSKSGFIKRNYLKEFEHLLLMLLKRHLVYVGVYPLEYC